MRHFGKISLNKILPNLPRKSQARLTALMDAGWVCGFYLGVYNEMMYLCLAAQMGKREHLVMTTDSDVMVDQLCRQIARDAEKPEA